MSDVVSLSWTELLSIGGFISLVLGVAANYFRVTTMTMVQRHMNERLQDYMTTRELELRLSNLSLQIKSACERLPDK